jgi:hypothetical protein
MLLDSTKQAAQTRAEMKKLSAAIEQYREDSMAETNQENNLFTGSDRLTSRENDGDWINSSGIKQTKPDRRTRLRLKNETGKEKKWIRGAAPRVRSGSQNSGRRKIETKSCTDKREDN